MSNIIKIKRGASVPTEAQLQEYELGYCTENGLLYIGGSSTSSSTYAQCIKYLPLTGGAISGSLSISGRISSTKTNTDTGDSLENSAIYVPQGFITGRWLNSIAISDGVAVIPPTAVGTDILVGLFNTTGWAYATSYLPVAKGGTGTTSLSAGQVLIGQGTNAVTTRAVHAPSATGPLVWEDATTNNANKIASTNSLAYWDGRQTYADGSGGYATSSYLRYCDRGRFGSACTYGVSTSVASGDTNLVTGNAIYTAINNKVANYLPLTGGTITSASQDTPHALVLHNTYSCESLVNVPGIGIKFLLANDNSGKYASIEAYAATQYANTTAIRFWHKGSYPSNRGDNWFETTISQGYIRAHALAVLTGNWGAGTGAPANSWSGSYTPVEGQLYFKVID